jgi:hypothetical protein
MAVFTLTPLSSLSGSIAEGGSIEFTIIEGGFTGVGGAAIASELDIVPSIPGLDASNVQQALEELTELIPSEATFTQSDLSVLGIYPYIHNKNKLDVTVQVWDGTSQLINVDEIISQGVNAIGVNLETYVPILGTWKIKVS